MLPPVDGMPGVTTVDTPRTEPVPEPFPEPVVPVTTVPPLPLPALALASKPAGGPLPALLVTVLAMVLHEVGEPTVPESVPVGFDATVPWSVPEGVVDCDVQSDTDEAPDEDTVPHTSEAAA